jgi:membrane associated rhomboid family serine protease
VLPLRDHLPTRTFPFVNYLFIVANIVVYVLEEMTIGSGVDPQRVIESWGLVPRVLFTDPVLGIETAFSSMFMHASLGHIAGNMLFLWIFGDNVEDAMGHVRYLVFYLLGGLCAAAAQVIINPYSTVPLVGASGAIASVLAAYMFLYPRSPITVLNPFFILWLFWGLFLQFPAWLVIALWFLVQFWDALTIHTQGGTAFMAHVGGFIGGAALLPIFMAGRPRLDNYDRWQKWYQQRRRMERDGGW